MVNDESLKDPVLPLGRPTEGSAGKTGTWRTHHPELIEEKCIKCHICWMACPEGTIRIRNDGYPEVELVYCKGCGICVHECPKQALHLVKD